MTEVGRVIDSGCEPALDLQLVEDALRPAQLDRLAADTFDPRLTEEHWRGVLEHELVLLANWLAHRALDYARAGSPSVPPPPRAVTLLPSYGFALHALRRSVPFAALGIATTITVPAATLGRAHAAIEPVVKALGLSHLLSVLATAPPQVVEQAVREQVPVYLTGRTETWRLLREKYPEATLVGATGRCAVVLSRDRADAANLERLLDSRRLPISCSNHLLTLITDAPDDVEAAVQASVGPLGSEHPTTLGEELRRAHPSVILVPAAGPDEDSRGPSVLAGYSAVSTRPDGTARSTVGFGRDPVAGWPGDYLV
ncbi:MAG TPA: hypothetical protein VF612_13130 [Jatrophihabitans sp.]|jgi:hypothetical protein|uniref:hypothetical protein n=1 Tax=Jatrophihabitans sp. TaxID=1932789 RepID=UPI002F03174F